MPSVDGDVAIKLAQGGFALPRERTFIPTELFWQLTDEGWRFIVGEDGKIVAYSPPSLESRLRIHWTLALPIEGDRE
jgi:hypothetical protein